MYRKPLLSIAIATKNREKYCIESIKSILSFQNDEIEITVADNSDTDQVKQFVEEISHPAVKYIYDNGAVSSIENFNRAMELTTGEYVMLIGDDDSILPKLIEIAKWAKENNADSICSKENLVYYWPGVLEKFPDGGIILPKSTGKIEKVNIKKNIEDLVKNGLQLYLLYPLPKTYHGLVRKSVMEEVKRRTGHYYGGLSPDIYSSIAVSCIVKKHYTIDEPLSIAGVCATSTTADNFKGKHSGSLENIPHLRHRENYQFSEKIPLYYSVNTIWAESGLKALEELKETELLKKFNIYKLVAQAWIHNKKFIPELMEEKHKDLFNRHKISYKKGKNKVFLATLEIYGAKLKRVLQNKMKRKKVIEYQGFSNLSEVIKKYKTLNS